ncbi:MAG: protein DA1 [Bacteroidota bacterium]
MKYNRYYNILILILFLLLINNTNAQEVRCKACNKTIKEKYIVVEGNSYHPNHFVCTKCNKPIRGNYYKKDGNYFDAQCYTHFISPKCAVCLKPLTGKYLTDLYDLKYHNYHENELHRCDNCNMLISQNTTKGGVQYSDGRNICNNCKNKAVSTNTEYERSLKKIIRSLRNYRLEISLENVKVHAVDRNKLKQVSNTKYSNSARGYCQTTVLKSSSEIRRSHDIYILDRVPAKYIEATLAHELMHVWINENIDHKLSTQLEEGSCNYISYTYLKSDYSEDAQNIIKQMKEDQDPIYGEGFRKVYKNFNGKYLTELLKYLKNHKTIY